MRLTELRIDALPGLERPLHIERFAPGVNVVLGPNASGKSSLIRGLLALLYPAEQGEQLVDAEAALAASNGVGHRVRRLGETVSWESGGAPAEPPPLPPRHLIGTYVLRLEDLLGPWEAAPKAKRGAARTELERTRLDTHIAQRLDKELTGGIDLKAVRRAIGAQAEKGQKLAGELRDATAAHSELRRSRADLQRGGARLVEAKRELAAAGGQAARKHLIADAATLLDTSLEISVIRAELDSFPPHLGELLGNEADDFAQAVSAKVEHEHDLRRIDDLASDATRRLGAIGLPATMSVATAELHLDLAEALVGLSERLSQKERELAALGVRHAEALRRLGGPLHEVEPPAASTRPPVEITLDDATLEKVERLLDQRQAARAEEHELHRQLEEMSRLVEPTEDDDALLDVPAGVYRGGRTMDGMASPLRGIRHDLVKWLREPATEPRRPDWAWGVALGLTVATVAAAGLNAPGVWLAALAGAAAAWLGITWLVLLPARSPLKARIQTDVEALQDTADLTLPGEWNHGSVIDLVLDIDDEIARRASSQREHDRYDQRLRQLLSDSQLAQRKAERLQAELEGLRGDLGFGVAPDTSLALWLRAARDFEATRALLAAGRVELRHLTDEASGLERRLQGHLVAASTGPGAEAAAQLDPLSARTRCRELLRLAQTRDAVLGEREGLARERQRVEVELRAQLNRVAEILARANIRPSESGFDLGSARHELSESVAQLPAWRSTKERLRVKEAMVDELKARVVIEEELLAAALSHDRVFLETAAASADRAAERAQALSRDIHRTERDVENAGSERRLQQLAARLRAATDALVAHRQVAIELAAGEFMLNTVEAEHEAGGRPAALERAGEWFSRFTEGTLELTFEPSAGAGTGGGGGTGGGRRLGAKDTGSGRRIELAELSTGTRAQLLLASRLAFALEAEGESAPLPFFLDEALTTSDEQRFKQVASAVLSVAQADSRQFIYLSARGDDADLWRQVAAEHGTAIELIESFSRVA